MLVFSECALAHVLATVEILVQRSREELKPATTGEDFTLGYFCERKQEIYDQVRTSTGRGFIIGKTGDGYVVGGPTFT